MPWKARGPIAILLALAFATGPLILDHCTTSCEHARTGTSVSEPTCHHGVVATARVGSQRTRCGHNHEGMVTTLSGSVVPTIRAVASGGAVIPASTAEYGRHELGVLARDSSARSSVTPIVRLPPHLDLSSTAKH